MRRRVLAALAALAVVLALLASPASAAGPRLDARAWALVDARTGQVLDAHAGNRRLPVASTTKLMTAWVALQRLPLGKRLTFPAYAAIPGESLMELAAGERVSVRDLLRGLLMRSGNDAAVALAEASSGSVSRFVAEMNRRAAALGLSNTHYANPIGLDQSGNYSTALDLTTLGRRLLQEPRLAAIVGARYARLRSLRPPQRIANSNDMLWMQPWVTGIKTGHTFGAGYVLVGSARRDGVELVSAVLGAPSEAARYAESLELLEYGFSLYERRVPVRAGEDLAEPAIRYSGGSLPLRAPRAIVTGTLPDQSLRLRVRAPSEVEGPLRRGARLGRATVFVDGVRIGAAPLLASRSIPAASSFDRFRDLLANGWAPVAAVLFVILMLGVLLYRRIPRRNDRVEEID